MPDDERLRGHMSVMVTYWCGKCNYFQDFLDGISRKESKTSGWKNTRRYGWLCRDCASEHKP